MADTARAVTTGQPPTRLARRLGLADAVVIGLGSMIGAGVFAALAPAAQAAGAGMLLGLVIAAVVAFCNAVSSAQLAVLYPASGGTYVYARERLGHFFGYLAGFGFVVGKLASLSAMALTFGFYVAPSVARSLGIAAVVALTAVNYVGVEKTARLTRLLVALVVGTLVFVVASTLVAGAPSSHDLTPLWTGSGVRGILASAGFLFFAFAGYARIATLGEEVRDPGRTIGRAIPLALGITVAVYVAVAVAALAVLGPQKLAASKAPLAAAVTEAGLGQWVVVVRLGAAVASLGVLLSLLAGVSRTTFAMAAGGDLPRRLAAVHPRYRVPHVAELVIAAVVVTVVALADLRSTIGFSSVTVLVYYAITNASALTLPAAERRWPRGLAVLGLIGCVALAVSLPVDTVGVGLGLLGGGAALYAARHLIRSRSSR